MFDIFHTMIVLICFQFQAFLASTLKVSARNKSKRSHSWAPKVSPLSVNRWVSFCLTKFFSCLQRSLFSSTSRSVCTAGLPRSHLFLSKDMSLFVKERRVSLCLSQDKGLFLSMEKERQRETRLSLTNRDICTVCLTRVSFCLWRKRDGSLFVLATSLSVYREASFRLQIEARALLGCHGSFPSTDGSLVVVEKASFHL